MPESRRGGVVFAVLAYGSWGLVPLFWRLVRDIDPLEILAHRVAWSLVVVAGLLAVLGGGRAALAAMRSRRTLLLFLASSAVIGVNWGLFIWAVSTNHLSDASLGYFINPLANVVLGVVALKERLGRWQRVSVALAAIAVLFLVVAGGVFPWLALTLAGTFAAYGLMRKLAPLESLAGLFVETLVLAPVALGAIAFFELRGGGALSRGEPRLVLLLAASGAVTALPLVWFAAAARRLPLSTLGLFQYIAPSLQLLVAVFLFGEVVEPARWGAFALIWLALAIHSVALVRDGRLRAT